MHMSVMPMGRQATKRLATELTTNTVSHISVPSLHGLWTLLDYSLSEASILYIPNINLFGALKSKTKDTQLLFCSINVFI